jgi:hypothetical protein
MDAHPRAANLAWMSYLKRLYAAALDIPRPIVAAFPEHQLAALVIRQGALAAVMAKRKKGIDVYD